MRRIVIYVLILGVLLFLPLKGNDIGKLQPVEVVQVHRQGGEVLIRTDTGDQGIGSTAELALQNLKDTTPGYIYLDTAEYLLLNKEASGDIEKLRPVLRKSLQLCFAETEVDLQLAAKFLPAHGNFPQLKRWKQGDDLPLLTVEGSRLKFMKKNVEKS